MNSERDSRTTRSYNNAFREGQARQTRERILDTVVALLREGKGEGLSVPKIAERSGISVATIYRHFPDRDALYDGVSEWMAGKLGRPPVPESVDDLVKGAAAVFRYYEDGHDLMKLLRDDPVLRELHESRRRGRDRLFTNLAEQLTEGTDPARAKAVAALIRTFYGFDAYATMRSRFGLGPEEAGEVVAWAAQTLMRELERESEQKRGAGKNSKTESTGKKPKGAR